jgi:Sec-independent protein translocase protein TatA
MMFGIGFPELVIIGIVAIIFIRPEDLPSFFRAAGRLYAKAKQAYDEVATIKDDFIRVVNEALSEEERAAAPSGSAEPLLAAPSEPKKASESGTRSTGSGSMGMPNQGSASGENGTFTEKPL